MDYGIPLARVDGTAVVRLAYAAVLRHECRKYEMNREPQALETRTSPRESTFAE